MAKIIKLTIVNDFNKPGVDDPINVVLTTKRINSRYIIDYENFNTVRGNSRLSYEKGNVVIKINVAETAEEIDDLINGV